MKQNNVSKLFSTTLSLALAVTSAPIPAGAAGPVGPAGPAFVAKLTPPEQFGYVASSYAPNGEEKPRLIVIADLHAHLEVQRHIENMLDFLVNKLTASQDTTRENIAPIFIEGGWTEKLEHPLSRIHNLKLRSTLASYFLAKAEMPAAQAFSERYPDATNFTLTGVENYDEYQANREHFVQTYPERKQLLDAIARHEQAINDLADIVQPKAFGHLQQMRKDYFEGKVSPERYAKALARMAVRYGISNSSVETLKNSSGATSAQLDMALHIVYKAVLYAVSEGKPLSAYFRKSLGDESKIRENLALIDTYLDLLKRTLSNQLTPEEVPLANARVSEMSRVADFLIKEEGSASDTRKTIVDALTFYPYAIMRDTSLVENSLKAMDKNPGYTTGVLVAGGFHVGTISDYLREHRIPFMVINPTITRDLTIGEQINYVKRMAREHVSLEEMRVDFANGFGRKTADKSALAEQAIGNTATEPLGSVDPKTRNPGKPGAAGATEDALLGALDAKDEAGNPVFVSLANGVSVADGVIVKEEDAARVAAVTNAVHDTGFFEAKIADPSLGATFSRRDVGFEGTGKLAADFDPVIQAALKAIPEDAQEETTRIHVQVVNGDTFLKMKEAKTGTITERGKQAIVFGIGTPEKVILINQDYVPNRAAAEKAIGKMKPGQKTVKMQTAAGRQSLRGYWLLSEEIAHGLGGLEATQGQEVDVERTGIFLTLVAQLGGYKGAEHSATGGLSAVELPTAVVNGSLRAVEGLSSDAAVEVQGMTRGVKSLSLGNIINNLRAGLDLDAQREAAAKAIADDLAISAPGLRDTQRALVAQQIARTVVARFEGLPALKAKARKVAAAMDDKNNKTSPDA